MRNKFLPLLVVSVFAAAGCGSVPESGANGNTNANVIVNVDPANLPPEFSTKPLEPSANSTPGIPPPGEANIPIDKMPPAEGIPAPDEAGKPVKPGATPTPGIPSEAEIRRQMSRPATNVNSAAGAATDQSQRKRPGPVGNQQ